LLDGDPALVRQKVDQISLVERSLVLTDSPVAVRVYAKSNGAPRELARVISALAVTERWKIEELHTEEGRLDEVFRSITQSEIKPRDSV
jgi:ABC-2 type transport system ATP-binding protein